MYDRSFSQHWPYRTPISLYIQKVRLHAQQWPTHLKLHHTLIFIAYSILVLGEHPTAGNDIDLSELTATVQNLETPSKSSHTLPKQIIRRRGRRSNTASPNNSPGHNVHNFAYEGPCNFDDTEEERDHGGHEVLTFHGLILRSQLTEMFKNKTFFNESEGVSLKNHIIP